MLSELLSVLRLADKELQRKSLEDSLNSERSCGANRETKMQVREHRLSDFIFHAGILYLHAEVCRGQPLLMFSARICFVCDKCHHLSSLVFFLPTGFAQREHVIQGGDPESAGTDF